MYNLSECAVPVFYFLSAYLFYRNFDGSWPQYKRKLKTRFFSLFIPYVIFCTFGYFKHLIVTNSLGGGNFIGWIRELWVCQTMPLWFVRELMFFVLLSPLFFYIKSKKWLSVILSLIILCLIIFNYVPYSSFIYWTPVYLIGVNMKPAYWDIAAELVKRFRPVILILLAIYVLWCWFLPNGTGYSSIVVSLDFIAFRLITPILSIPVIIMIANSSLSTRQWMNYSFFVYCMHFPVIQILKSIYNIYPSLFLNSQIINYLFIVVLSYSLCVVIAMFTERYLPRVWQVINGRR